MKTTSRFLTLASAAVLAAIIVSCGSDDDGGSSRGSVSIRGEQFQGWDPHFTVFAQDIAQHVMVWRGLYHFGTDGIPVPAMADSLPEVSDDGTVYTVHLRKGLKWSDGDPLEAADFALGVQRSCEPAVASGYQYVLSALHGCNHLYGLVDPAVAELGVARQELGIRALDSHTIEFTLDEPQPTFTYILAMWVAFPAPAHLLASADADWPTPLENVYNGPFMPSKYTESSSMTLVRNPNWAGPEKPRLDSIIIHYIDDKATGLLAYRTGDLDAVSIGAPELAGVRNDAALVKSLVKSSPSATSGISMNMNHPVLAKLEVRRALSRAIDRDTLNRVAFSGAQVPTTNWIPPQVSGTREGAFNEAVGFNPEKARADLAAAGYKDGNGFPVLRYLGVDDSTERVQVEFLQAEWKKHLNITIEAEFVDSREWSSRLHSLDYELTGAGWLQDYGDPENWLLGIVETDGGLNSTGCSNPKLDDLLDRARFNRNDAERRGIYREAERVLVEELCGQMSVNFATSLFLVNPKIGGMSENASANDYFVAGNLYPERWFLRK